MTNQGNYKRFPEKRPMDSEKALHRWMGYEDFKNGRGFRPEYETFQPHNQRNYEAGRQYAAGAMGAAGSVPKWGKNRKLSAVLTQALGDRARANSVEINALFRPKQPAVEA